MASALVLLLASAVAVVAFLLTLGSPFLPLALGLPLLLVARVALISSRGASKATRVGFFHPFTNDGGGGERVLWCMVQALQKSFRDNRGSDAAAACEWVVYTGDEASPESLAQRAKNIFGIELAQELKVVRLSCRALVEAAAWPQLTLFGQSLGSMVLAAEAVFRHPPHVFIDTAGYAFAYPVVKLLAGCSVGCYTHYPTISTDMLRRVAKRESIYNNSATVAKSSLLSALKLQYYRAFALAYGLAGWFADLVLVNSSWTEAHIRSLWRWTPPHRIHRVFPPCDTTALQKFSLDRPEHEERFIISIAQFRPEKNHALQLRAFARALAEEVREHGGGDKAAAAGQEGAPGKSATGAGGQAQGGGASPGASATARSWAETARSLLSFGGASSSPGGSARGAGGSARACQRRPLEGVRLKLVGGSRNREDEARIELLASLAAQLGISGRVDFCVNIPFSELQGLLKQASCGLHTMLDEHFGISIVEYMAAGAIAIAHNSGGPKADILRPVEDASGAMLPVGFLAETEDEYAGALREALVLSPLDRHAMALRARQRAASYSQQQFAETVQKLFAPIATKLVVQ